VVCAANFRVGGRVSDRTLGLTWTVVGNEGDWTVQIERNGVTVAAYFWELELAPVAAVNSVL
jgi:hypothetical protein